jgi:putative glutamine amidotransferase
MLNRKFTSRRYVWVPTLIVALVAVTLASRQSGSEQPAEKPLIGITMQYRDGAHRVTGTYARAVTESGGIPMYLPITDDSEILASYVETIDGLLCTGGADIPPEAYGEEPHETTRVMPMERYNYESKLIEMWFGMEKPVVGVCLGSQFANVVAGGTLVQDIPSLVGDRVKHRGTEHLVTIAPGSRLAEILGERSATVNSYHHQAAKRVGSGLRAVAHSPDGVIEALEFTDPERYGIFIQWHPERMDNEEHRRAIFSSFIKACQEYKAQKAAAKLETVGVSE